MELSLSRHISLTAMLDATCVHICMHAYVLAARLQRLLADEPDPGLLAASSVVDVPTIKEYFVLNYPREVRPARFLLLPPDR